MCAGRFNAPRVSSQNVGANPCGRPAGQAQGLPLPQVIEKMRLEQRCSGEAGNFTGNLAGSPLPLCSSTPLPKRLWQIGLGDAAMVDGDVVVEQVGVDPHVADQENLVEALGDLPFGEQV